MKELLVDNINSMESYERFQSEGVIFSSLSKSINSDESSDIVLLAFDFADLV